MRFLLIVLLGLSVKAHSCPLFEFKNLVCKNGVTGQISKMKQFKLYERPEYQVLFSEVGIRLRTFVLPYSSQDRYGKTTEMLCEDDLITIKQYFGHQFTEVRFYVDTENNEVSQVGQVLRVEEECNNENSCSLSVNTEEVSINCVFDDTLI